MFEPISVSLLPNTFKEDVFLALRLLFSPTCWIEGKANEELEKDFEKLFPGFQAVSYLSGRTALLAILKSLGIGLKDEVILQSFTCVVVPNAIISLGAIPIYADIEKETLNLDPQDLEKKITPKTRAIIVQHTFGYPAKMESIVKLAKRHHLLVIEDCAHVIGRFYQGQKLGTLGEAAFFSFGRDKVISSVFGGIAITRNKQLGEKLKNFQNSLNYPANFWVFRQLIYLPVMRLILATYNLSSLGKVVLFCLQQGRLLLKAVDEKEKRGIFPLGFLARLPNSLACLARRQLSQLSQFNKTRQRLTSYYAQELKDLPLTIPGYQIDNQPLPLLRFTIRTQNAQFLFDYCQKRGVLLNNWYYPAISPSGVDYQSIKYNPQSCPVAEEESRRVVNLPTHPRLTEKEAAKIVSLIRLFFGQKDQ